MSVFDALIKRSIRTIPVSFPNELYAFLKILSQNTLTFSNNLDGEIKQIFEKELTRKAEEEAAAIRGEAGEGLVYTNSSDTTDEILIEKLSRFVNW